MKKKSGTLQGSSDTMEIEVFTYFSPCMQIIMSCIQSRTA